MSEPNTVFNWQGKGWYGNVQRNGAVWYEWCGADQKQEPHTYTLGLGNPDWYDAPPTWAEEVKGTDYNDDDTPAMPTLEDALARLAMESPEAARAARNFLEGTAELRTVWVRFRVSERERTQIDEGMRAAGIEKISEYCRGKVLG